MDPADCPPDSTCGFLAFTVSPLLGNLFAISLFLAPLPRVLAAVNSARLDGLNVLPYPLIAGNCLGWLLYGLFLRDSFLVLPNAVGLLTGLYYVASVIPLQPPAARKITTNTLILSFLWLIVGAEVAFVLKGPGEGKVYMGSAATGVLLVFFASPLSSLFEVIRLRDSSSIHVPLAIAGVFNGGFWSVYGYFLGDPFVLYPNVFGFFSAILQLLLVRVFPRSSVTTAMGPPLLSQPDLESPGESVGTPRSTPSRSPELRTGRGRKESV